MGMIQSDFSGMISPKTIRFSGDQFCFGVETLDNATGELFLARNQLSSRGRCRLGILVTFFMGSIFECMVFVHHLSRNCPAQ